MVSSFLQISWLIFYLGARSAHGEGHHSTFKYVTMDEACVPQGSWKENYNKQQTKFNTHLIVGVVSFVATCAAVNILFSQSNNYWI